MTCLKRRGRCSLILLKKEEIGNTNENILTIDNTTRHTIMVKSQNIIFVSFIVVLQLTIATIATARNMSLLPNAESGDTPKLFEVSVSQDTIQGMKFNDLDGDGVKDPGELGLSNWRIRLFESSIYRDSVLTDQDGNYFFSNIGVGTYTVDEVNQSGWAQTFPTAPGLHYVELYSESTITGINFGNFQRVSIGGIKFNDLDGDGERDLNDPGLANWRMRLFYNSVYIDSTLTDAGGNYTFNNVGPGTYTVSEQLQAGWEQTLPALPGTYTITTQSGQNVTGENFGNFQLVSISGMKFHDLDGDGVKDPSELGLSNWRIRLFENSILIDSVLTDVNGNYTFSNVGGGTYTISELVQTGWTQTLPTSPGSYTIAATSGQNITGKDFGNFQNGTISGTKFHDLDNDAVRDVGEPGLQNWRIRLIRALIQIDSVLTNASGNYTFTNVGPGTHTVSEQLQSGWFQTFPVSPGTYTISLQSGESVTGKDFGNAQASIVRGKVFYDRNSNGVQDVGEIGLTGWTVNATATNPLNTRSAVTQTDGLYSIQGLVPDTYTISEVLQTNWTQTHPPSSTYTLTITAQIDTSGFDFGNFTPNDTLSYRSFPPESLMVKKALKRRSVASQWCFDFLNATGQPVDGLYLEFSGRLTSFISFAPFTNALSHTARDQKYSFSGTTINNGETVQICGYGPRRGMKVRRWWWTENGVRIGIRNRRTIPVSQDLLLPMPNGANVRDEVFLQGYRPAGMTVGIPRPDARRTYGWALVKKSLHMQKALITRTGITHTGVPRGFDLYNGRPFHSIKRSITPLNHNNRLFAQIITLKFNIMASALEKTPVGFGELIYDEGANPLSGLTLNEIVGRTDSSLTFLSGVPAEDYENLDTVIEKINSAFAGPMDTITFSSKLKLTAVRSVGEVPFLRPGSGTAPVRVEPSTTLNEEIPQTFALRQNYPNPFNPTTTIEFELTVPSTVSLRVYNMLGQEAATLLDREELDDGFDEVEFDASHLPSGVYFYRLVAEGVYEIFDESIDDDEEEEPIPQTYTQTSIQTKKMLLIK